MKPSAFLTVFARALPALLMCFLCGGAWAQNLGDTKSGWQECNAPTITTISPVINVDVGSGSQVGDVIGQWTTVAEIRWSCVHRTTQNPVPVGETKIQVLPVGTSFPVWGTAPGNFDNNPPYTVYRLNQNGQEIGFIGKINPGGVDVDGNVVYSQEYPYDVNGDYNSLSDGAPVNHAVLVQIRMVKINSNFPAANSVFSVSNFAQFVLKTLHADHVWVKFTNGSYGWYKTGGVWDTHAGATLSPFTVNVLVNNGTCTTPSVHVDLGQMASNDIPSFFSPAGAGMKGVDIIFHDCPPNMASILYRFLPAGNSQLSNLGVLSLIPPSTAEEVSVQIYTSTLQSDGSFRPGARLTTNSKFHVLATNDSSGNYAPRRYRLLARMVRAPSSIPKAGTVHAALKIVTEYK